MEKAALVLLKAMFENRAALLLAMAFSACAYAYCLWQPDYIRLAAATLFTLLVYVPLVKPVRPGAPPKEPTE